MTEQEPNQKRDDLIHLEVAKFIGAALTGDHELAAAKAEALAHPNIAQAAMGACAAIAGLALRMDPRVPPALFSEAVLATMHRAAGAPVELPPLDRGQSTKDSIRDATGLILNADDAMAAAAIRQMDEDGTLIVVLCCVLTLAREAAASGEPIEQLAKRVRDHRYDLDQE